MLYGDTNSDFMLLPIPLDTTPSSHLHQYSSAAAPLHHNQYDHALCSSSSNMMVVDHDHNEDDQCNYQQLMMMMEVGGGGRGGHSSSSCSSCHGSPPPPPPHPHGNIMIDHGAGCMMQRSMSSQALQKKTNYTTSPTSRLSTSVDEYNNNNYIDATRSCAVRRVFSDGDLHNEYWNNNNGEMMMMMMMMRKRRTETETMMSSESCSSIIESMTKASKYSPQEKHQRILRYRTKRNLRNFNKKIKYECRKTLADSRPRIRGRFARNDEINNTVDQHHHFHNTTTSLLHDQNHQWMISNNNYSISCGEEDHHEQLLQQQQYADEDDNIDDEDDNYWVNFLNAANSFPPAPPN